MGDKTIGYPRLVEDFGRICHFAQVEVGSFRAIKIQMRPNTELLLINVFEFDLAILQLYL